MSDAPPKRAVWQRWSLAALVLLVLVGFYVTDAQRYFTWAEVRQHLTTWQAQTQEHLLLAIGLYALVYMTITALSLPIASTMSLVGGLLFGRWLGTAIVSISATLGATGAFLLSRYLFYETVQARFGERLRTLNEGVQRDGAYYLLTLRLIPVVPFFVINLGMGLTPIRLSTYVLVSWLGMLPGTFLYLNAGSALGEVDDPRDLLSWPILGALALLGVVPLLLRKVLQGRAAGNPS